MVREKKQKYRDHIRFNMHKCRNVLEVNDPFKSQLGFNIYCFLKLKGEILRLLKYLNVNIVFPKAVVCRRNE